MRELVGKYVGSIRSGKAWQDFDEEDACAEVHRRLRGRDLVLESEGVARAIEDLKGIAKVVAGDFFDDAAPTEIAAVVGDLPGAGEFRKDGPEDFTPAEYIIEYRVVRGRAVLHLAMGCAGARTLSFESSEFVEKGPVPPDLYDSACGLCWKLEAGRGGCRGILRGDVVRVVLV